MVCVLALDAKVLIQPIKRLMTAGMGVVLIGNDAPKTGRSAFLGPDEAAVGRAILESLAEMLHDHRTLMDLHRNRAAPDLALRYEGFTEALRRTADLKLLRSQACGDDPAAAMRTLLNTSERFPSLGGWALLADWLTAELPEGRPLVHGSARVVSYGARPANLKLLEDGRVHALVGIDWEALGFRAMEICFRLLNGGTLFVTDYRAPPVLILPKDVEAYRKTWQRIASGTASRPAAPEVAAEP